ncbi:MAG: bifunctional tetrahydrofolate synthase/dihydrofolate synthase [Chromatiaceae bacterium]|nr:bifunctional tetrahydrofolate synthase/dihydrofolate synthase [Chromatiaceae bacterium]
MSQARTLDDWLAWQTQQHPARMALGLERVAEVWRRLAPAPLGCPVITVGGTNGKGSCVAYIEAMASAGGYRCGGYGSPHLLRYNERVRIAGQEVSDEALCAAFAEVEAARGATPLTYFEYGTLAALWLFTKSDLDLVVLEVGLGGRLDAVNLIDADVAVVTSIGLDHTAWLGDTLEAIAREKAGIFRADRPAIIGQREAPHALGEAALERGARPLQLGRDFDHEPGEGGWIWRSPRGESLALPLPAMRGAVQLDNAAAALCALDALRERLPLSHNARRQGVQRARLPGRFQVRSGAPTLILDVAHNGPAAQALAANLRAFAAVGRRCAILAVLDDKDVEALIRPLAELIEHWHLTQTEDPRALPVAVLAERLSGVLPAASLSRHPSLDEALAAARDTSAPEDCILVFGSFTTVGGVLDRLEREGRHGFSD